MNEPVKRFRVGAVTASVWENRSNDRAFYSVTLQRSYKEDGEWKTADSYNAGDLLNLARVVTRCENYIADQ